MRSKQSNNVAQAQSIVRHCSGICIAETAVYLLMGLGAHFCVLRPAWVPKLCPYGIRRPLRVLPGPLGLPRLRHRLCRRLLRLHAASWQGAAALPDDTYITQRVPWRALAAMHWQGLSLR